MIDLTNIQPSSGGGKSSGIAFIIASLLIIWGLSIYKKFVDEKGNEVKEDNEGK